ncbi:50S ribosomal protein L37ae [Nanoarchaeota archaeon]
MKTKKVFTAGKFGSGYGKKVRESFIAVEKKQRTKQVCPYCQKPTAKRLAKGIWNCKFCKKKFTGGAFYLEA